MLITLGAIILPTTATNCSVIAGTILRDPPSLAPTAAGFPHEATLSVCLPPAWELLWAVPGPAAPLGPEPGLRPWQPECRDIWKRECAGPSPRLVSVTGHSPAFDSMLGH